MERDTNILTEFGLEHSFNILSKVDLNLFKEHTYNLKPNLARKITFKDLCIEVGGLSWPSFELGCFQ